MAETQMPPFNDISRYQEVIQYGLVNAHSCPDAQALEMLRKYQETVEAHFKAGLPPVDLIRWFYLEWKAGL